MKGCGGSSGGREEMPGTSLAAAGRCWEKGAPNENGSITPCPCRHRTRRP